MAEGDRRTRSRTQNAHALATELERLHIETAELEAAHSDKPWFRQALALIERADGVMAGRPNHLEVHGGWTLALEARRLLIHGLDDAALRAEMEILRQEVTDEVSDWRAKAALALLDDAKDASSVSARRDLVEKAMRVRDEHTQKLYRDAFALGQRIQHLTAITVAAAVILIAVLCTVDIADVDITEMPAPLLVTLFGLLGGAISAYKPITGPASKRYATQWAKWTVTAARPFVGAAAALALYPVALSGIVPIKEDLFPALAAVSVAAGFSERVLWRALAAVAPEENAG